MAMSQVAGRIAPSDNDLLTAGAAALARRIAAGEVSTQNVMSAHLARIAEVDPLIHAFVDFDADKALAAASAADAHQASGSVLGPLHGVPVSVKDWIEVEGFTCAAGIEQRRGFRPRRDATVAARLKAAGAIILGKTVTNDGGTLHPRPNNPHDLARSPGASSSGEAALVAALGSPLGLGSDSGGSIRFPAAWCGVAGLKPTSGRVPLTGHYPPIGAITDPRTVIGPIARRVEDLALAMRVIAGPDGMDPAATPVPLRDFRSVAVKGLKIAVADFAGIEGTRPDTLAAVKSAAARLEAAGCQVEIADAAWWADLLEESRLVTEGYWARPTSMSLKTWAPYGDTRLTGDEVGENLFRWERLQRQLAATMTGVDAILCPVSPTPAVAHRPLIGRDYLFTLPFSLTGQPVATVTAGWSGALPIGVQIVARKWADDVALALAAAIED